MATVPANGARPVRANSLPPRSQRGRLVLSFSDRPRHARDVRWQCSAFLWSAIVHLGLMLISACLVMRAGPSGQGTALTASFPSELTAPLIWDQPSVMANDVPDESSLAVWSPALPRASEFLSPLWAEPSLFLTPTPPPRLFGSGRDDPGLGMLAASSGAGRVSENPATYSGVMDSLAQEVGGMLQQTDVTLIWCFDESLSMKDDQQEIAAEVSALYRRLSDDAARTGHNCQSVVTSYGEHFHRHLRRPTADFELVHRAMLAIPVDPTGHENMCEALRNCLADHAGTQAAGQGQVALVLVTDETGDRVGNRRWLEQVIAEAHTARARIFVIGREALFGVDRAWMRWQGQILAIDRGPETAFLTRLGHDAFGRPRVAFGSGFGPYEQCRLAAATQGRFFMLASSESAIIGVSESAYDPEALARFRPELDARDRLDAQLAVSPLRRAVVAITADCGEWFEPRRGLPALTLELAGSEAALRTACERQEAAAEVLSVKWQEAARALSAVRKWRAQETHPRWQADFDLLEAQLAVHEVQTAQYLHVMQALRAALAAQRGRFGAARIALLPSRQAADSRFAADVQNAEERLGDVAARYAGTPWGECASQELAPGLGLVWNRVAP